MYVMLCWREGGVLGVDSKILKRGGALCWSLWLAEEENFRFQMVYKGQNNVTNYRFLEKYFYHHFQIFSIFKYNESFSKCANTLIRKEKNPYATVNGKRETEKSWTLFDNRLFYKVLQ